MSEQRADQSGDLGRARPIGRMPIGRLLFRDDGPTIGVGVSELLSPSLLSIVAAAGADYGFVDMEHTSFSFRDVASLIAGAQAIQLPVIVRPPDIGRSSIGRALDVGADGIVAQGIGSREDAAAVVRFAKYRPIGDRGYDGRIPAGHEDRDSRSTIDVLNANTIIIATVETEDGVDNIDEICTTQGIDAVWIGPTDLSLSLDVPGDLESQRYRAAEERILESCRAHGMRFAIGAASTPAAAIEQIRLGCFMVLAADEVTLLRRAISDYVGAVRALHLGSGVQ